MKLNSFFFDRRGTVSNRWITIACVLLCIASPAFGSDKCGSLDRAANAIRLAEILYPELRGKEFSLQFSDGSGPLSGPADADGFLIAVDKPQWHPPAETSEQLDGARRSQDGTIEIGMPQYLRFTFTGSVINAKTGAVVGRRLFCWPLEFRNDKTSKQMLDAAQVINDHPEWTDAQDLEAARKFGMRFGPDKKTDLLGMLPLRGLSSIYGLLQITKANFRTAGPKEPGSYFADLHWYITAKHIGSPKTLQIMVEPFNGKITALSR